MEIVILICLLIVIVLLLQDKVVIHKRKKHHQKPEQQETKSSPPDIIGKPRTFRSLVLPNATPKGQFQKEAEVTDNFEIDIDHVEVDIEISQEEPEEVLGMVPDLEQEEEEWNMYKEPNGSNGFATGVTFEELSAAGMLLQQDVLEQSQKAKAARIVQKIQGTELLSLLENSMEGASKRIAELLDQSLSTTTDNGSSFLRKTDLDDFDIGEFV